MQDNVTIRIAQIEMAHLDLKYRRTRIDNAGAVFLGPASTEPVGDYFAGTNHVLPTNGAARYASSLGVSDFVKSTSVVRYTPERLARVGDRIVRLAHAESMEAHARAVQIRLEDYGS